ncbi:hypothetical protein ACHAWC_010563 [Mediolabrus comicus]
MSSIPACQLTCLNGGYCDYISSDSSVLIDTFARGGLIQKCICAPGYSGISCENKVEPCSDDLKCHNGVSCALDESTGLHYCDCSVADEISSFAGKMCRQPATSYCGQGDIKNRSFCTNGGICQANIYRVVQFDTSNEYSTHKGCSCPVEFEGDHCEFLREAPLDDPEQVKTHVDESAEFNDMGIALVEPELELEPLIIEEETLNHSKESAESKVPETETVQLVAPAMRDESPFFHLSPSEVTHPDSSPITHPDNSPIDLESASKEATIPSATIVNLGSKGSVPESNQLGGHIIALLSISCFALFAGLLAHRRLRKQRQAEQHFVLGDNYRDETPIRVKVRGELERNELDEVLGLDNGSVEYEDDDDMISITERSECSLEEIEIDDQPSSPTTSEDDDEFAEEPLPSRDYNPFAHIIGPLVRSLPDRTSGPMICANGL